MSKSSVVEIPEPRVSSLIFADTRFSVVWFLLRIYVGWQWFSAGLEKLQSSSWVGNKAGTALLAFVNSSLVKSTGPHADVQGWYAVFLQQFVLPNVTFFSYIVTFGEILVGLALIFGILTGISAFFGAYMNMNYLLAGTVSINPVLFAFELLLILAWRIAGWWGLDRYVLPFLGAKWENRSRLKRRKHG